MFVLFLVALVATVAACWAAMPQPVAPAVAEVRLEPVGLRALWLRSEEAANLYRSEKLRYKAVAALAAVVDPTPSVGWATLSPVEVDFGRPFLALAALVACALVALVPEGAEALAMVAILPGEGKKLAAWLKESAKNGRLIADLQRAVKAREGKSTVGGLSSLANDVYAGVKVKGVGPVYTDAILRGIEAVQEERALMVRKGYGLAFGAARELPPSPLSPKGQEIMDLFDRLRKKAEGDLGSRGKGLQKEALLFAQGFDKKFEAGVIDADELRNKRRRLAATIMAANLCSGSYLRVHAVGLLLGFEESSMGPLRNPDGSVQVGKDGKPKFSTKAQLCIVLHKWGQEDKDLLQAHMEGLVEIARENGHFVSLDEEMALQHAVCPFQVLAPATASTLTVVKTWLGQRLLEAEGAHRPILKIIESREIWAPAGFQWPGVTFLGGEKAPMPKAVKGLKYAKALFAPMAAVTKTSLTAEDCADLSKLTSIPEAAVDGQVLITLSEFKRLCRGICRKKFLKKAKDPLFQVFIGRLFIPGYGLVKGGFMVVPDHWLVFNGVQKHIVHWGVKEEVVLNTRESILCASSNLKHVKEATTDLQNFLMSGDMQCPRFANFFGKVIDTQIAQREDIVAHAMASLEEDAEEVAVFDDKDVCSIDFSNDGLKEVVLAKVLQHLGYDVRAFAPLYVALFNQVGDGEFRESRFRATGKIKVGEATEITEEGEVKTTDVVKSWRTSWYYQPHPGRTILALEEALGKLDLSENERSWLESWEQMEEGHIQVSEKHFFEAKRYFGTKRYITRRPMTATGGVPMEIVGHKYLDPFRLCGFIKPTKDAHKFFWYVLDGADADDSFQENRGEAATLMTEFDRRKRDFASELSGEEAIEIMELIAEDKTFFGLTFREWDMPWTEEDGNLVDKVVASRLGEEATNINPTKVSKPLIGRVELAASSVASAEEVCPATLWSTRNPLVDLQAWTGSAANAQMFAMFVLQGFMFKPDWQHAEEARKVASAMVSIMLSDIIDAQQQGNNIPDAATSMKALMLGTLMLAQWLVDNEDKVVALPEPMKARAMWFVKNLLKDRQEDGTPNFELVGATFQNVAKPKPVPAAIPSVSEDWEMYDHMSRYINWLRDKVQSDLEKGVELGQQKALGLKANVAKVEAGYGPADSLLAFEIGQGMVERSKRLELVSLVGGEKDEHLVKWASLKLDRAILKALNNPQRAFLQMLGWTNKWEQYGAEKGKEQKEEDAKELEVKIDPSTMKLSVTNGGSRTAFYGDVAGLPGFWRYFAKWLLDQKQDAEQAVTLYSASCGLESEALVKNLAQRINEKSCTIGDLMDKWGPYMTKLAAREGKERDFAGWRLVNGSNPNSTSLNVALTKMRKRNKAAHTAYLDKLKGQQILSATAEVCTKERLESWTLRLTFKG